MKKVKFDYELQAWCSFIDGEWWIEDCGHPDRMKCNCKGRVYKGYKLEDVPQDKTIKELNADRLKKLELKKVGNFEKDTGGRVDVYTDKDGLLII